VPLGGIGTADDVAHAVVCLASPGAACVTGQAPVVDGGVADQMPQPIAGLAGEVTPAASRQSTAKACRAPQSTWSRNSSRSSFLCSSSRSPPKGISPLASTIFMSTPCSPRPGLAITAKRSSWLAARCSGSKVQAVPSGLISVMSQACSTGAPNSSWKLRGIAGGQAEPPMTVQRMVLNFRSFAPTCADRPCQTVGTPAEPVTFSCSTSTYRLLPSRARPGKTSFAASTNEVSDSVARTKGVGSAFDESNITPIAVMVTSGRAQPGDAETLLPPFEAIDRESRIQRPGEVAAASALPIA
jgi:hypothetical protein